MKFMRYFLVFCFFLTILRAYDTMDDALKNGITKGDVILYGQWQGVSRGIGQSYGKNLATFRYLGNLGYLVGSVRIGYTSGFYKNVRASLSFASVLSLYNVHKNLDFGYTSMGRDFNADFFSGSEASLGETFIEYFDGDTSIKAGRIFINNEWTNMLSDGLWFRNKSLNKILIEGFWSRKSGRVDYYQITDFRSLNPKNDSGVFNLGVKYSPLEDSLSLKLYTYFSPAIFYSLTARAYSDLSALNEKLRFGVQGGISYSFEADSKNSYEFDLSGYIGFKDIIVFKSGYVGTSKNSGLGSLNTMGDSILPFFVWGGRAIRIFKDANLFYLQATSNVKSVNFCILYAITSFSNGMQSSVQNEINLSTEIKITQNIYTVINLLNTHVNSNILPNLTQINGGIRIKF